MKEYPTFLRAINFIKNFGERGLAVKLKADGSVPATLTPPVGNWTDEGLTNYLLDEIRMSNFRDVIKTKGHGSIYLTTSYAESVLHIRVLDTREPVFYYTD